MRSDYLLKLADHLESGKLGHEDFDFRFFNANEYQMEIHVGGCGYSGCAIGECPIVFPEDWEWINGRPKLHHKPCLIPEIAAHDFFKINPSEFAHLFVPNAQAPSTYGGIRLDTDATRKQVAANIRAFVAKRQEGQ